MSRGKVIYDSDDEDEEEEDGYYSPVNLKFSAEVPEEGGETEQAATTTTRSTDPGSFQSDDQFVEGRDELGELEAIPNTSRGSRTAESTTSASAPAQTTAVRNSSSITDPVFSARRGGLVRPSPRDLSTQVTTPSQPTRKEASAAPHAAEHDVWELPSSQEAPAMQRSPGLRSGGIAAKGKTAAAKTYSKRKRGQGLTSVLSSNNLAHGSSGYHQQDEMTPNRTSSGPVMVEQDEEEEEEEEDASPRPAQKRRKSSMEEPVASEADDVDLVDIPRSEEANMSTRNGNKGIVPGTMSIVPDTLKGEPSFYIATSNLSASQKQNFVRSSSSSDLEKERLKSSLPAMPPPPTAPVQQVTNSGTTVAFTTPSRFDSSSMLPPPTKSLQESKERSSSSTATSSRKRAKLDKQAPFSSPDELANQTPKQKKSKATKHARDGSLSPEGHASLKLGNSSSKTKQRGTDEQVEPEDDSWDSDNIGYHREQYNPRPSRRRPAVDVEAEVDESLAQNTASASARKKKQKAESVSETTQQDDSWDSDKIGYHRETYKPKPSRRRSEVLTQSMPDTEPPGEASCPGNHGDGPILVSSGQEAPPKPDETIEIEGVDPSVFAELPEDIQKELIAEHLAQRAGLNSQASRTRSRGLGVDVPSTNVQTPPQPKKRGRKKKVQQIDDVSPTTPQATETGTAPDSATPAPAKRKRGRPKKSEAITPLAASADLGPGTHEEQETPSISTKPAPAEALPMSHVAETPQTVEAPAKRGRKKKKIVEEPPPIAASDDESAAEEEVEQQKVLQDISSNISSQRVSSTTNKPEDTPVVGGENGAESRVSVEKARAMDRETPPKSSVTENVSKTTTAGSTGKQGRVPLRVGLSKRSRIAPLLKIIKK